MMRTLINYAIIYSIARNVFSKHYFSIFRDDCGQFGPFCKETGQFALLFPLQSLENIKNLYINSNL